MSKYSEDTIDWFARFPYQTTYDSGLSVRELFPSAFEGDEFIGSFNIDTTESPINVNTLGSFFELTSVRESGKKLKTWVKELEEEEKKRTVKVLEKDLAYKHQLNPILVLKDIKAKRKKSEARVKREVRRALKQRELELEQKE